MPYAKIKLVTDACCHIPNAHLVGRSGEGFAACGVLILNEFDQTLAELCQYLGEKTVPQAEYGGLIFALERASEYSRGELEIWMDSELVVRQMNGNYALRKPHIKELYDKAKGLEGRYLGGVKYFHHPETASLAQRTHQLAEAEYRRHR